MPARPLTASLLALALTGLVAGPGSAAVTSEPLNWRNVTITATGFMPGIVFHPTAKGVAYIRADMGGGYRLDPATRRWIPLMDFTKDYVETGVESIALDPRDPQRVYFMCGTTTADWAPNGYLLRSTNQGESWDKIPLPVKVGGNDDGRSIGERLAVDPHAGNILFMGSRQAGLWRSADHGSTWTQVEGFPLKDTKGAKGGKWPGTWGEPSLGVGVVVFDERSGSAGSPTKTIYVGAANKEANLYRSTDAGTTWAPVPGQPVGMIPHHLVLAKNGILYATYWESPGPNGNGNSQVWKLDTASGAWTEITPNKSDKPTGFGYVGLAVDAADPEVLMVSTTSRWWPGDEQYRSLDGGKTWKEVGPTAKRDASKSPYLTWGRKDGSLGAGNWEGDIEIDPTNSNRVLYVTGATVWGCDNITDLDQGKPTSWTVQGEGIEESAILDLLSPVQGPPLISAIGDVYGFTHEDTAVSPPGGMMQPMMTNTGLAQAGRDGGLIVRVGHKDKKFDPERANGCWSSDQGRTWTPFATAPTAPANECEDGSVTVTADGSAIIWAAKGKPAFRSTDRGTTWTPVAGLGPKMRLVADAVDPQRCYAIHGEWAKSADKGPKGEEIWNETVTFAVSTDGGASFKPAPAPAHGDKLTAVPGLAGNLWLAGGDQGLRRSTDGGATWTTIAGVEKCFRVAFGKAAPGQNHPAVYASGVMDGKLGVFRSDDQGANWARLNDDLHTWGGVGGPLTGDPKIHGRWYLGTNGRGIIQGDLPSK